MTQPQTSLEIATHIFNSELCQSLIQNALYKRDQFENRPDMSIDDIVSEIMDSMSGDVEMEFPDLDEAILIEACDHIYPMITSAL